MAGDDERAATFRLIPSARNYVRNNTDYNGKIRNPVLTMHTIVDPLVTVTNEQAYAELNCGGEQGGVAVSDLHQRRRSLRVHRSADFDGSRRD